MNYPGGNTKKTYRLSLKFLFSLFLAVGFISFATAQTASSATLGASGPGDVDVEGRAVRGDPPRCPGWVVRARDRAQVPGWLAHGASGDDLGLAR